MGYLNCRLSLLPFLHLGIPIGANPRRSETWDQIVLKCERKFSKLDRRHLSFGGRVTLIKSILNLIPIFYFFRVPKKVVDRMIRLQSRFLCGGGGDSEHQKLSWVSWETICLPKERGGLGVRDLLKFNYALLGKWW